MQIDLTGHHVDLTDPLRNYVNDKFGRLERHFDHVTDVHVILSVEKTPSQGRSNHDDQWWQAVC